MIYGLFCFDQNSFRFPQMQINICIKFLFRLIIEVNEHGNGRERKKLVTWGKTAEFLSLINWKIPLELSFCCFEKTSKSQICGKGKRQWKSRMSRLPSIKVDWDVQWRVMTQTKRGLFSSFVCCYRLVSMNELRNLWDYLFATSRMKNVKHSWRFTNF